jgi:hypothetical protein
MTYSIAKDFVELPDIWDNWGGFEAHLEKSAISIAKKESFSSQWLREKYAHDSSGLEGVVSIILNHDLQMHQHFYMGAPLFTDSFCFVDTTTRGHMFEGHVEETYDTFMSEGYPDLWQGRYANTQDICIRVGAFHKKVVTLSGRIDQDSFENLMRAQGFKKDMLACLRLIRASVLAIVEDEELALTKMKAKQEKPSLKQSSICTAIQIIQMNSQYMFIMGYLHEQIFKNVQKTRDRHDANASLYAVVASDLLARYRDFCQLVLVPLFNIYDEMPQPPTVPSAVHPVYSITLETRKFVLKPNHALTITVRSQGVRTRNKYELSVSHVATP